MVGHADDAPLGGGEGPSLHWEIERRLDAAGLVWLTGPRVLIALLEHILSAMIQRSGSQAAVCACA